MSFTCRLMMVSPGKRKDGANTPPRVILDRNRIIPRTAGRNQRARTAVNAARVPGSGLDNIINNGYIRW